MGHRNSALGWGHAVHAATEGQVPRAGHLSLAFWSSRAGRTSSFPRAAVAAGLSGQQGTLRARWVRPKRGACGVLGCTKLPAPRLNPPMLQMSTTHSTAPAAGTGPGCCSSRRARVPLVGFRPSAGHFHGSRFAPVGTGWSQPLLPEAWLGFLAFLPCGKH